MSFLNAWILLALPLIGLPIVIHLMNQRRHKPISWGAMHFLRKAKRMNTGVAKLRYWFIMLLRMMAIAALIFGLSRPLATGWFGRLGAEPRTSILLLDRSPSMEFHESAGGLSKRATGLQRLDQWFSTLPSTAERILIATGLDAPLTLAPEVRLSDLAEAGPCDASTHMADLLEQALQYLERHESGPTDIWICSDRSQADWEAEDGRWVELRRQLAAYPEVRLMLLSYPEQRAPNLAIRVDRVARRQTEKQVELVLDLHLQQTSGELAAQRVPLTLEVGGVRTAIEIELKGKEAILNGVTIPLDSQVEAGAGLVEIPGDANPADNVFHFTFAKPSVPNTIVVTDDDEIGSLLELACQTPSSRNSTQISRRLRHDQLAELDWTSTSTILWHGDLPSGPLAEQLMRFVADGRSLLFLPPTNGPSTSQNIEASVPTPQGTQPSTSQDTPWKPSPTWGMAWRAWNTAPSNTSWKLRGWRTDGDLLSHTESNSALPLHELQVHRYCQLQFPSHPTRPGQVLAEFENGEPLLYRAPTDRGSVYFFTSLPNAECSTLAMDGVALYVMLQRLIAQGVQGLSPAQSLIAGTSAVPILEDWTAVDEKSRQMPKHERRWHAGSYRLESTWMALNRHPSEDQTEPMDATQVAKLLGEVSYHNVDDQAGTTASLANEIWRVFVIGMVVALLLEAKLTLPKTPTPNAPSTTPARTVSGGAR